MLVLQVKKKSVGWPSITEKKQFTAFFRQFLGYNLVYNNEYIKVFFRVFVHKCQKYLSRNFVSL